MWSIQHGLTTVRQIGWTAVAVIAAVAGGSRTAAAELSRESTEFFEAKIRPVLVEKCYSCHSDESKKLKGDLKVDSPAGLLRGGESGSPSVVPGHPDKSKLIEAIEYKNDDLQMPPKEKLPAEVVANFRQWVQMGAPDPRGAATGSAAASHLDTEAAKKEWWSFKPPQPQTPPTVKDAAWVRTPIDQFILAKLEAQHLAPNKPADKRTLIRRATFDLIGLPPTAQEVADFEADTSPNAFAKVVDRLLASPHYGERWARYWLDVARYADTKGYVFEEDRRYPFAYTFRDWVVRAFNEDLPYDQFVTDQLAADKLDLGNDKRPLAAMGFLTVGRRFLNNQADIIDDRLDVIGRGILAMTVGCARCHDHKFDPIPTKDYYSLYGVLASSMEPTELPVIGGGEKTPQTIDFEAKFKAAQDELAQWRRGRLDEIVAQARSAKGIADALMAVKESGAAGADEKLGAASQKYNLRRGMLMRWKAFLARAATPQDKVWAAWESLSALPDAKVAAKVEEAAKSTANPLVADALRAKHPKSVRDVADCYGEAIAKYAAATAPLLDANEEALRQVLFADGNPAAVKEADVDQLLNRAERQQEAELRKKIDGVAATHPGSPARAMVLVDLPQPVQPHVFKRGNPANVGDAVPRAFLAVLSPSPRPDFKEGSGRLELAQAIVSKDNPVTARVIVNRIWGHHFGQGIVRTPSDFGRRGDLPTHPELLDYLALRFVNEGHWAIKQLHRWIMLSAVYQQSSDDDAAKRLADPDNKLLWKFNRQRLDFEATRDALLAASGQIDLTVGGKAVDLAAQPFTHRRTIYGSIDRQNLPSMFRSFDFASPDSHSPQRYFTTVPQQALFLMNGPFTIDAAKALAKRPEVTTESDPAKRVAALYKLAFDRAPTRDEVALGVEFVTGESAPPQQPAVAVVTSTPTWQYGYGEFDEATARTKAFHRLTHFTGQAWQGGPALPDPATGWAMLNADGGHPGNDPQHAVIRRWTAPRDGNVKITGTLAHAEALGDGVRGRIVSSRAGLLGTWVVKSQKLVTTLESVPVTAGDTVDFIVDCYGDVYYDSFGWSPEVTMKAPGAGLWNAAANFSGDAKIAAAAAKLDPWEKYAQVLLETNEFVFVD